MQTLKNLFNNTLLDDKTQDILSGHLESYLITDILRDFNSKTNEEQILYLSKIKERSKCINKPKKALTVLLLLDEIIKSNSKIHLPHMSLESLIVNEKDKESIILGNILNYYLHFLRCNNSNRFNVEVQNIEDELEECQRYCQFVIKKIEAFLKIDFVFSHGLKLKDHKILVKTILRSILLRFKEDLEILTLFVKNNVCLISQKTIEHHLTYHINYLYEKLINLNKNMKTIEKFNNLLELNIKYSTYEIDLELNRQIELSMMDKKSGKKQFQQNLKRRSQNMAMDECQSQKNPKEQKYFNTTESFLLLEDEE